MNYLSICIILCLRYERGKSQFYVHNGDHPKATFSLSTKVEKENFMTVKKNCIKQTIEINYDECFIAKFAFKNEKGPSFVIIS